MIQNMRRRSPMHARGYTGCISGLYRVLRRLGGMAVMLPNPDICQNLTKRWDIRGKECKLIYFCLVGEAQGQKFYRFTFIDEYEWIVRLVGNGCVSSNFAENDASP